MNDYLLYIHLKANKLAREQACEKGGTLHLLNEYVEIFANLIIDECIAICKERGDSAAYSYTPSKAAVAKKMAYGCAELIKRTLQENENTLPR